MIDLTYATAGALTGLVVGFTGVGGGALMTPILLLFFGVSPTTAVATDLWFAALTKLVAARIHFKANLVDWMIVRRLWWGSLPAALVVVLAVVAGTHINRVEWLTHAIGAVVMLTAVGMIFAPRLFEVARRHRLADPARFKAMQPALTVTAGAGLGILVALTSVGAGALGSVILLFLYPLRMVPHRLVATDIVHAIPLAVIAGLGYLMAGMVDFSMLGSLLVGSIPAVIVGSKLSHRASPRWVRLALAATLLMAGFKTIA